MEGKKRKVTYQDSKVVVKLVGPLKDEAAFEGCLMIVEESHGPDIEWHPLKIKTSDLKSISPELENLDWEDISSSVGFKASHDESLDAVEIKAIRMPNVIKFDISDLKSYKKTDVAEGNKTTVVFLLKDGTHVPSFQFEAGEFGSFCAALDGYVNFKRSKKESNLYLTVDPKVEALEKSFSELELFSDSKSHILKKMYQDPYTTALGGFSKVTNFLLDNLVYNGVDSNPHGSNIDISQMLTENILNIDINNQQEPGFEVVTCFNLPPRPTVTRDDPVTPAEWDSHVDSEGRIKDTENLKQKIFRGGLSSSIRSEAWKYLLGMYSFENTTKEKAAIRVNKTDDYFRMKLQWREFTVDQESRFSALRERRSIIEKDVSRTDRTHPFFEGENNKNVQMLQDILMTYCMYNFDLGYVQGMSDLLSPILVVMQDEVDAFWCFAGWLKQIGTNFELEQHGMKNQLQELHRLLYFVDSILCSYLEKHDSGNLYFAFRWLLILFKRDFKFLEIMRLWEVLWTGLPCKNFHLLICLAILDSEKLIIMENEYGLSEILKHVNEMSYKINLESTLCKAEAIYIQIRDSDYRSDVVETILGLPHVVPKVTAITESPTSIRNGSLLFTTNGTASPKETTDYSDEYVDLEHTYRMPFDLPY